MSNLRLRYLLERYASNAASPEEIRELFLWLRSLGENSEAEDAPLKDKMLAIWADSAGEEELPPITGDERPRSAMVVAIPTARRHNRWIRLAAASLVALALCLTGYYLIRPQKEGVATLPDLPGDKTTLVPGGDKAILTLANGEQIILDNTDEGDLKLEGNTRIIKLDDGQLAYRRLDNNPQEIVYNTISTPRGGQYKIVLSDSSKVWLNAASSLRFPVYFHGERREVELTGEGYFEVAPMEDKPFIVHAGKVNVEVLGTQFNVNAYPDERVIRTTLVEGAVNIRHGEAQKKIHPGQQAQISHDPAVTGDIAVKAVDVSAVTAWKNGRFIFKEDDIRTVMRQLARWYDAEVSYDDNITNEQFVGVINRSRYDRIPEILQLLEKTGTVSFSVQGRHIRVMPYQKY